MSRINIITRDYSLIGYYGRPITDLSRKGVIGYICWVGWIIQRKPGKNKKGQEVLGKKKFDFL